jgi:hypothetical protein
VYPVHDIYYNGEYASATLNFYAKMNTNLFNIATNTGDTVTKLNQIRAQNDTIQEYLDNIYRSLYASDIDVDTVYKRILGMTNGTTIALPSYAIAVQNSILDPLKVVIEAIPPP